MIKCVGYNFSSGRFEKDGKSFDYDNIVIYYVTDSNPSVFGLESGVLKVKRSEFPRMCTSDVSDLLDKEISLDYVPLNGRVVLSRIRTI